MAKKRKRALSADDQAIAAEVRKRLADLDEQKKKLQQHRVAAHNEYWRITDDQTPEWLLWDARQRLLVALNQRLAQLRPGEPKEPIPPAERELIERITGDRETRHWLALRWHLPPDPLQNAPAGRPRKAADRELVARAQAEGLPGHPDASFRAALIHAYLIERGVSQVKATQRALQGLLMLEKHERYAVLALERIAYPRKKRRRRTT